MAVASYEPASALLIPLKIEQENNVAQEEIKANIVKDEFHDERDQAAAALEED